MDSPTMQCDGGVLGADVHGADTEDPGVLISSVSTCPRPMVFPHLICRSGSARGKIARPRSRPLEVTLSIKVDKSVHRLDQLNAARLCSLKMRPTCFRSAPPYRCRVDQYIHGKDAAHAGRNNQHCSAAASATSRL